MLLSLITLMINELLEDFRVGKLFWLKESVPGVDCCSSFTLLPGAGPPLKGPSRGARVCAGGGNVLMMMRMVMRMEGGGGDVGGGPG